MISIAVIPAVLAIVALVFAVCTAVAGALIDAVPIRISLFAGPSMHLATIREADVRLGLLPFGSGVRFLDEDAVEEGLADEIDLDGKRLFEHLPLVTRLTVLLVGWVAIFLIAQAILGLRGAATELGEGFRQIVAFLTDRDYAPVAAAWLKGMMAGGRFAEAGAVIAMKVTAFNFLPLPGLTGGEFLLQIASSAAGRRLQWPSVVVPVSLALGVGMVYIFVTRMWNVLV
jgi:membrane-associated protease RseP (regulator of RpoE activity)